MSDDVIANPGAGGVTFATDDDGTRHYPWTKLVWGPNDVFNKVDDATGKRLPVKVAEGFLAGSILAGQISLSGPEAALTGAVARRFRLKARTDNTDVIYLGPVAVTTANGYPLWPGDSLEVDVSNLNVLHAIVGSGTQILAYVGEV